MIGLLGSAMVGSEGYRGYEYSWEEPPLTSAGYDITIASEDTKLQRRLEDYLGRKGAHALKSHGSLEHAKAEARALIDAILEGK
ncbi:MAG TPA: hypothetical protein VEU06_11400 [Micropepsaceae bacterium]|nr:hypothetical protein [Micropepsaceae bacterium]